MPVPEGAGCGAATKISVRLKSAMKRLFFLLLPLLLIVPVSAAAQELQGGLGDLVSGDSIDPRADFSARFIVNPDGQTGVLQLTADVVDGCHIYSVTQPPNGPGPATEISIDRGFGEAELTGPFEPDSDYELHEDEFSAEPGQEHRGSVTWSAPIRFVAGGNPQSLTIPVRYFAQVCVNDGLGGCNQFSDLIEARAAAAVETFAYEFAPEGARATVRGWIDHTHLQPGDGFNLNLQIQPQPGWQVEGYSPAPTTDTSPTMIVLTKRNDATLGPPVPTPPPEVVSRGEFRRFVHDQTVTWKIPVRLPRKMETRKYGFGGWIGFRAISDEGQQADPVAVAYRFAVTVGTATVDGQTDLAFYLPEGADYGEVGSLAQQEYERTRKHAGQFSGLPIYAVLGLAFVAGLILNVMPCVLPVIGLKVLSFVQQAGENPRRVLLLNLVFAAGIISVFLLLAAFAAFMGMGWGGLFESQAFTIVMVSVVFVFGLSFLGVWEIPIPGFVAASGHGKAAQQEGYVGAFLKGILTTLLATPCSGPLLIPAVTWAIAQPPAVTFLTFLALGLGMAFPFILIGFRPSLVGWLPKPGEWMETFKQLMGFVMLATAVFFFNPVEDRYEMPVLAFMVFLALACWMAGRISLLDEWPMRARKWAAALVVAGLGGFVAFYLMVPQHELEWQPYSQMALNDQIAEGNVVFVDFTADW
jgi:cytochrome c biogenesis protein CcdA